MSVDPLPLPSGARPSKAAEPAPRRAPALAVDPTFFSRYECKYIVDPRLLPPMRSYLEAFTRPDSYAALCSGNRYLICSLYLDSPDLGLYYQTVRGEKDRFKLRVRTYSDDGSAPAFLEVKRKLNAIVHKRRAGLSRERARRILAGDGLAAEGLAADVRADAEYFRHHLLLTEARPVARVRYWREAYQAHGNEPVRITFDTGVQHAATFDDEFSPSRGRWTSTPIDGAIVEVKFTERFPTWVQDFVRSFGLGQQTVPKYVLALHDLLTEGGESALALAGLTLPPRRGG